MKKKLIAIMCVGMMAGCMLAGCGNEAPQQEQAPISVVAENETTELSAEPEAQEESVEAVIQDGIYSAEFQTDSSMFHVNEMYDNKGTLTVENGKMTIHITLVSKNIVNLFPGVSEDAQKEGAELLQPTVDTVDYGDGTVEEVYGFDVPVPVLDQEFDVALIGTKGTWYDHKVSVTNVEPMTVTTENEETE